MDVLGGDHRDVGLELDAAGGRAHDPAELVRRADEARDPQRLRRVVDGARLAQLLDLAVAHDDEAVGHAERLLLVVGDVDERRPERRVQLAQLDLHVLAQLAVERPERLVEQQHARAVHERARERDALLHAARELGRAVVGHVREAHQLEHLGDTAAALVAADALAPQPVADVALDVHVREQGVALEDRVDVAPVGRHVDDVAARDLDAAAVGADEAADDPHRRRLAAAARPEHGEELAGADLERQVVERHRLAVALADAAQHDLTGDAGGAFGRRTGRLSLRCRRRRRGLLSRHRASCRLSAAIICEPGSPHPRARPNDQERPRDLRLAHPHRELPGASTCRSTATGSRR